MKKKLRKNLDDYEINLIELFKYFWNKKNQIIFVALVIFSIGYIYANQKTNSFEVSLEIKPSRSPDLKKLTILEDFIEDIKGRNNIKLVVLDKYIRELKDTKKLMNILEKSNYINKNIFQLSEIDRKTQLYGYTKLFNLKRSSRDNDIYIIKFNWDNAEKSKEILQDVLDRASIEIQNSLHEELLANIDVSKNKLIKNDMREVEYLVEQLKIAKSLKIENEFLGKISNMTDTKSIIGDRFFRFSAVAYYLRGEQAIQQEIDIIKNRKYQYFDKLIKEADYFKNQKNINWVEYNIIDANLKSDRKIETIISNSALLGLIIGVVYVLISYLLRRFSNTVK